MKNTLPPLLTEGLQRVLAATLLGTTAWIAQALDLGTPCLLAHPSPTGIAIANPAMIATIAPFESPATCLPIPAVITDLAPGLTVLLAALVLGAGVIDCLYGVRAMAYRGETE